ncbi:Sporulation-delaying protein SdpB [Mycolicibacterium smegmatis MKD8]|uniref:Sporulation-delaying protein SdpB n=2 Tax=Mycolicibacterium smegmatis TaxID=1772 RepID=A0A2U9PV14_MYCSE|nr:sporulation-delaying protein SdpB family protein [Mycolicibacterium smegmatis]AWT55588.1 Sporulation-delaying protein SdpB [Mycolicibacterium smegmatis MKD8]
MPSRYETVRLGTPWTNCFGAARSLIALGPLLTLVFTRSSDLFFPLTGDSPGHSRCAGPDQLLLFCLGGSDHYLEVKRWVAVAALIIVAIGWKPQITCIPHAYVAFSYFHGLSAPEGGDQIASIVALLLVPVCLTDRRTWHWQPVFDETFVMGKPGGISQISQCLATVTIVLIKLQVSWVYLQAGISKLGSQAWVNGTAMYYWSRNETFGVPGWEQPVVYWLTRQPVLVAAMTWTPVVIEVMLGISLLLPLRSRIPLLCAGFGLHLLIGVMIGLWSFAIIMWGCLVFLLSPAGLSVGLRRDTSPPESQKGRQTTGTVTEPDRRSEPPVGG